VNSTVKGMQAFAKTIAGIAARALSLEKDGYTIRQLSYYTTDGGSVWLVTRPDGKASYTVFTGGTQLGNERTFCTCQAYAQYKCCKHCGAVGLKQEELAAYNAEEALRARNAEAMADPDRKITEFERIHGRPETLADITDYDR